MRQFKDVKTQILVHRTELEEKQRRIELVDAQKENLVKHQEEVEERVNEVEERVNEMAARLAAALEEERSRYKVEMEKLDHQRPRLVEATQKLEEKLSQLEEQLNRLEAGKRARLDSRDLQQHETPQTARGVATPETVPGTPPVEAQEQPQKQAHRAKKTKRRNNHD